MTNKDEDLVATLTAISVVAKRMAGNIIRLSVEKGEKHGKHRGRNQKMRRYPKRYR